MAEGLDREGAVDLMAQSLQRIVDHAADRNVTLCEETHDDWCGPAHVAAVLRRVNHPAVGVNREPYDVHLPRELATMKRYEELVALGVSGPAAYGSRVLHCRRGPGRPAVLQ